MGLFSGAHSSHEPCPLHDLSENATTPLFGSMSFYTFNMILSGACTAFACAVIFFHMFRHATHLSNPGEQVKIIRVSSLIPLYSVFSLLSICFPKAKVYLLPWLEVFQSISLSAFFLLMCDYISPSQKQRDVFFAALTYQDKKKGNVNGLMWFRKQWFMIFQYLIVTLAAAIATDITEAAGVYCQFQTKTYFAKLWISIIKDISLAAAVTSILMFVKNLKPQLEEHRPMIKLIAFKLVVALGFLQNILWMILNNSLKPSDKLTYADLFMGIPSMLSCIEMVPISVFLAWAYSVRPYVFREAQMHVSEIGGRQEIPRSYQGGPLGIYAFLEFLSPMETLEAIVFTFTMENEPKAPGIEPEYNDQEYRAQDEQYLMEPH